MIAEGPLGVHQCRLTNAVTPLLTVSTPVIGAPLANARNDPRAAAASLPHRRRATTATG
jgi:hypothetical protein